MRPSVIAFLRIGAFLVVLLILLFAFPRALAFAELAARQLRYFWWLILLLALGLWLIWGFKQTRR